MIMENKKNNSKRSFVDAGVIAYTVFTSAIKATVTFFIVKCWSSIWDRYVSKKNKENSKDSDTDLT